jgi:hypothetical protein
MEVSGQLHALAILPPGKEPLVPIGQEAGWAPDPVWMWYQREKFPAHFRNAEIKIDDCSNIISSLFACNIQFL